MIASTRSSIGHREIAGFWGICEGEWAARVADRTVGKSEVLLLPCDGIDDSGEVVQIVEMDFNGTFAVVAMDLHARGEGIAQSVFQCDDMRVGRRCFT